MNHTNQPRAKEGAHTLARKLLDATFQESEREMMVAEAAKLIERYACNSHAALVNLHTAANILLELAVLAPNANPASKPYLRHLDGDPRFEAAMKLLHVATAEASAAYSGSARALEQAANARAALQPGNTEGC